MCSGSGWRSMSAALSSRVDIASGAAATGASPRAFARLVLPLPPVSAMRLGIRAFSAESMIQVRGME
jgi:hypothetical protein